MPVPTGAIGNTLKTALVALFNMTAEGCCPAKLYTAHHFVLRIGYGVILTKALPIQTKDVCDFMS